MAAPTKSQPYHHGTLRAALLDAAETILECQGIQALKMFYETEESKEGVKAFLEKRPAQFRKFQR